MFSASVMNLCRSSSNRFLVLYSRVFSLFPSLLYIGSGEGDLNTKKAYLVLKIVCLAHAMSKVIIVNSCHKI